MNENEIQLKVQALVDGELTGQEAKEWRSRLETDAGLKELHARLTAVRGLMTGAELPRTLPESGDFHWSQISRPSSVKNGKPSTWLGRHRVRIGYCVGCCRLQALRA